MQEQVGEHRGDRAALRGAVSPSGPGFHRASASGPSVDAPRTTRSISGRCGARPPSATKVRCYGVKEGPDVKIDNPFFPKTPLPADRDRVHGRTPGTIAIGVLVEHWLHAGLQRHRRCRLRDSVNDARYAEDPHPVPLIPLGYLHCPNLPGEVRPRRHPIPQPIQVPREVLLELLDRHTVGPCRSAILLDLLSDQNPTTIAWGCRTTCPSASAHARGSSLAVDRIHAPRRPRSLAPPPLRYAGASRLLRAGPPARPATVLSSSRILPLGGLPLAAEGTAAVSGLAFTRSIEAPGSGSCCLYAGTPPGP